MLLVTGGAGYVGSHVLRYLLDEGHECVVFDNLSTGNREAIDKRAAFFEGDLRDKTTIAACFDAYKFDAVLHFAALSEVCTSVSDPASYYETNVTGTHNLLVAMVNSGTRNIVFSSTCAVYGNPLKVPFSEDHPTNPINPYGNTKLAAERMLVDFSKAYGIKRICLRYFNAAGAWGDGTIGESREHETHIIPLLLKACMGKTEKFTLYGNNYATIDGTCIRDYVHVKDLAAAHSLALKAIGSFEGAINIGAGVGTSVRQIILAAELATRKVPNIEIVGRREGDPEVLVADNFLAQQILGWEPKHSSIKEIVETAYGWERSKTW